MVPEVLQVEEIDAGVRIDSWLAALLKVSRSRAQEIVAAATVDGRPVKPKYALKAGDTVAFDATQTAAAGEQVISREEFLPDEAFIYEDEDIIVINKPVGLVVHPGAGETGATLVEILVAQGKNLSSIGAPERPGVVHRLDKDTSGLILLCKNDEAHALLAADFEARRIKKTYQALVCAVPPLRGRIEAPLARSRNNRTKMTVAPEGRNSVTEYEVVKSWPHYAWLEIDLLTGRTHQIRVHLGYIHHPVVGDVLYGGYHRALNSAPTPGVRDVMTQLQGQALHAARLEFTQPRTGVLLKFESPTPGRIARVIEELDQASSLPIPVWKYEN